MSSSDFGMEAGYAHAPASGRADGTPTRSRAIANFVVFQLAWFAAVLGAAHGWPLAGTLATLAAIAWHVATSRRPVVEAGFVLAVSVLGLVVESALAHAGTVRYPSGQPDPRLAPYWIVALWGLFAIAPNVTLRWLKRRHLLAAALGAIAGPIAFASGARLGGATFVDETAALTLIALAWAGALPFIMALSRWLDGALPGPTPRARGDVHA